MPLNNRAPAAPIGKVKSKSFSNGPKGKPRKKRSSRSSKKRTKRSTARKMSAKQRKYFGKRRKR